MSEIEGGMKKFQFSLEKVLEVKEIEERIIQKDILMVQREILEKENNILQVREKISEERIKLSILNQKGSSSAEIMIHYKYLESLSKKIEIYNNDLNLLRHRESVLKTSLIEKSREKKSLEKLKEIKFEEYRKSYNKHQQIVLDEISIQNFRVKMETGK